MSFLSDVVNVVQEPAGEGSTNIFLQPLVPWLGRVICNAGAKVTLHAS